MKVWRVMNRSGYIVKRCTSVVISFILLNQIRARLSATAIPARVGRKKPFFNSTSLFLINAFNNCFFIFQQINAEFCFVAFQINAGFGAQAEK